MHSKKFKYQEYLKKYQNCPPEYYQEINMVAYRWVHNTIHKNDFMPINLINDPPPRMLDETDKMCMGYGLSLFNTSLNAISKYKSIYSKKRKHLKIKFIEDVGNAVAKIEIKKDGVGNKPNLKNFGHFTFHEYENRNLANRIVYKTKILFDKNGNIRS
ncbi:MAG: hypothetical protein KAH84_04400 [Thiomargarita sp.]|nr:hypothetical protein [Thiomargarita sp.]